MADKTSGAAKKKERLAKALRANLRRRKSQARDRREHGEEERDKTKNASDSP